jgi:hypothetical protein
MGILGRSKNVKGGVSLPRHHNNRVHVYNFGFFYMPSYQEETARGNREMGYVDGMLNVWEGDFDHVESAEHPDNHWPIV